jgi:sec-independent protein translocase protein TatA
VFSQIGPLEIVVVLVVILLIFGPKRLPQLGKSLGSGMRNFKKSVSGEDKDDEADEKPALAKATANAPAEDRPAEERQVNEALGRSGD